MPCAAVLALKMITENVLGVVLNVFPVIFFFFFFLKFMQWLVSERL